MTEEEIKKMQQEADAHKEEDAKRRGVVDARNNLDSLIYNLEKTLKESGDKVDTQDKKKVEDALVEARKKLER